MQGPCRLPWLEQRSIGVQGLASSDHTTLLLNCYAKLRDTAKLDRFLRAEGPDGKPALSFDIDTAIKVRGLHGAAVLAAPPCGHATIKCTGNLSSRYASCALRLHATGQSATPEPSGMAWDLTARDCKHLRSVTRVWTLADRPACAQRKGCLLRDL